MREPALREVLLVRALEEADGAGALLPHGDRERASREALRSSGIGSDAVARGESTAAFERALAARAAQLAGPLFERHPVLRDVLRRSGLPRWAWALLAGGALAAGAGLAALDGSRRINLLAPPFLGLLLWNLLVYLGLAAAAALRLRPGARRRDAPFARAVARGAGRRLGPLLARAAQVDTLLGTALRRFAADWSAAAAPLLGQAVRLWLHLGAACVAAGLAAGLYLRGLVLRYEAGWESTFLEPAQVKALLDLLFGRLASWAGIALPRTVEEVARLRWEAAGGGGPAAPWIHLLALLLAAAVVLPRLALAGAAWIAGRRLQAAGRLPADLAAYGRIALGAGPERGLTVSVTPYAYTPPPATVAGLADLLGRLFGRGALPELRPAVGYGDEADLAPAFDADAHRVAGRVLLMRLAATPETENHGAAIVAAREHTRRARPAQRLLVVLDEAEFVSRFAQPAGPASRLEERRRLWRDFVAGHGVEVAFTGEAGAPPRAGG